MIRARSSLFKQLSVTVILAIGWTASAVWCAEVDYFPLQVGNQWVYRGGGTRQGTALTLEITRTGEFNGKLYSLLHGYPLQDYWLRVDDNGSLVAYDPQQNQEKVWYAFQAPEREAYNTSLPGNCCSRGMIASRQARYKGPIGEFDTALEITYPGVFQVGIEREFFLPYVGMVHRGQATGGPSYATYDLIYARIGGFTVISEQEVSFSLSVDQSIYYVNLMPPVDPQRAIPQMTARLTLRNTTSQPLQLTFPSGQIYDLVLRNQNEDIVYRWSDGWLFTQALRSETVAAGEKNYVILVRLSDPQGNALPPGKYTAEGWLTTIGAKTYAASVGFEIQHIF